jgi:uncharacterized protein YecT (DUF1311 family)
MTFPRLLRPALAAILFSASAAAAAPLPVADGEITRSTDSYEVEAHYPQTGLAAIDDAIEGYVDGAIDDFVQTAEEDLSSAGTGGEPLEGLRYGLDIGYDTARNDDSLFAVLFSQSIATGGAHPNHYFASFNFLRPDGWRVFLPEIFDGRGLKRISELAVADLTEELAGPDGMSDTDWIKDGAGPSWDNFADFVLLPDSLVIHFPPYQVAAYAAGPQEVEIPLDELTAFMRPDWRAPAASFDCGKAGTAVEMAICSDVALARLDRDGAGAYGTALKFASDDAAREAVRQAQRAWLSTRDRSCGGDVACLTRLYEERLAELKAATG